LLVPVVELLCALHSVVHLQLLIFYSCNTCCTRHWSLVCFCSKDKDLPWVSADSNSG